MFPSLTINSYLGILKREVSYLCDRKNNILCKEMAGQNGLNSRYKRIYNCHIRKTGGTSLNRMFLGANGGDGRDAYQYLVSAPQNRIIREKVIVGWNKKLIEEGVYFYAFSHIPFHQLDLPSGTYKLVCFRDPVKRVISHYTMLLEESFKENPSPWFYREKGWLGDSFEDFIDILPKAEAWWR